MAKGTAGKNYWALLLMILAGVVLGGFIGQLSAGVPALRWLNYGQTFGLSNPLVLDLGILVLTFGLTIKITIAGIIGIVLAILIVISLFSPILMNYVNKLLKDETLRKRSRLRICSFIVSRPMR